MYTYQSYHNYDLKPMTRISGHDGAVLSGYAAILDRLKQQMNGQGRTLVVCDLYPGVDRKALVDALCGYPVLFSDDCLKAEAELNVVFRDSLSDDRVFGYMTSKSLAACFDMEKVTALQEQLLGMEGLVFVVGIGASSICNPDILLFFDINRWEIQQRYRSGAPNWLWDNPSAPVLEKYKRGFFIEWRLADRHKDFIFSHAQYLVDANAPGNPKMVPMDVFLDSLEQVASRPFRMEPYFDPGVWGGQWMKAAFDLDGKQENFAWSFDGVPEENSLNLQFGDQFISVPAMDLVLAQPQRLLGGKNLARFGREFPIRFDLLDTMEGQNLSLQVHPLVEYIQRQFGMHYTQDESYYILDAKAGACVYIGLKEDVDRNQMIEDLRLAQKGTIVFDADKYINRIPVQKHDHVLIPAGTIHCSGSDTMVLEISATPYIFTFKLWDWERVGLDGLPRPIHVDHGLQNIQWDRTTSWVEATLIHQEQEVYRDEHVRIEKTGLHELEFIETRRYSIIDECTICMGDSMDVLNLVEGECATIESMESSFELHYAETMVIPSSVGQYRIVVRNPVIVMVASVRN